MPLAVECDSCQPSVGGPKLRAMAKPRMKSVDEYIAAQPEAAQGALERVRAAIRKALPHAKEVISYNIPAYKIAGKPVIYFAGWKQHFSLYPVSERVVASCQAGDAPHEVKNATIRFPLAEPVPVALIDRIVKLRAKEAANRE
jgi:uncharacterized protein YdhG (YjbR/CyaY superfamily)